MNTSALFENLSVLLPEIVLIVGAMIVMMADIARRKQNDPGILPGLSLVTLLVSLGAAVYIWNQPTAEYMAGATSDAFSLGVRLVVGIAAIFGVLLSGDYLPIIRKQSGEYYSLLLLAASGMMLMGSATDLIVLFIALEIFSLGLYILSGFYRENPRSTEAAMKYFLLGAFASSFFVYGAALLYGAGGSTNYAAIGAALSSGAGNLGLALPGIALLVVGFGFKVSLVPFHMWTPDVYQGAPTPVTAFMSVGTKAAAFAGFIRVLLIALPSLQPQWGIALAVLAVVTMTVGNLTALRQTSIKRMLAYSSVAHAGYLLVGIVPGTTEGSSAALFYLFAYAFMNIGAFAVAIAMEKAGEGDVDQSRLAGVSARYPMLALAMAIFMLSLAGIPPLAGFFGKFFLFKAAVDGGWAWLVAVGVLNSAISAYYYLRVTVTMYFSDATEVVERRVWAGLNASVVIAAVATVVIGLYPSVWTGLLGGL
ncbi:MAG: NADH-quinone oxidoreductase subunit N [Caldilineaceae bacterium]|nr:NADH-quinone oxidoreductase subunit N [Caldilineaceae bacterium]